MTSHHKLIAGTVAVAMLAGGGASLAAIELSSPAPAAAPAVTALPTGMGSYGLGPGRLGGRGLPGGLGPGDDVPGARDFGRGRAFLGPGVLTAAASYLGLPSRTLRARLVSGATLVELARAEGKSIPGLIRALALAQRHALSRAVSSGLLTKAQAARLASDLDSSVHSFASARRPPAPPGATT